ncbi:MAG: adenylosuccinate lyase [Spirochaetaceae bacterium]|jgi:adenylosuccinate lyase|nr:adenylosuccinate lyase [Spirochaetaceae bacterium]
MEARTIFQTISPLDHRYALSEPELFDALVAWISEEAVIASCVKAEIALVIAHLTLRGALKPELKTALEKAADAVDSAEVYAEEAKTHHNIRALVQVLKRKVPPQTAALVHLGATSVDILDTALAYRMRGITQEVILPRLRKLEGRLCALVEQEAASPQVGRTHGQHAVPITLGFALAEYVSRLGKTILEIQRRSQDLKGKLSGAVGAYNAMALITADPEALERLYLQQLGLEPSEHATQLVEPEYLLRLLLEFNVAFGILANLADDLRNLQRSEIGELRETFGADQVGSSTMPQKRNPWNAEHVKSLWKAFMPRTMTFFMDQISEHQRDLTNSASQRFIADYVCGFSLAVSRMTAIVQGLKVDRERLAANLRGTQSGGIPGGIMAEPAYILLAETGISDAHEVIRRITLKAEQERCSFACALAREEAVFERIRGKLAELGLSSTEEEAQAFFEDPQNYCGLAAQKATALAEKYRKVAEREDGACR